MNLIYILSLAYIVVNVVLTVSRLYKESGGVDPRSEPLKAYYLSINRPYKPSYVVSVLSGRANYLHLKSSTKITTSDNIGKTVPYSGIYTVRCSENLLSLHFVPPKNVSNPYIQNLIII